MVYNTGVIRLVISTTLLGCLALTQAGPSVPQVAPVPYETPEAYEVYAAFYLRVVVEGRKGETTRHSRKHHPLQYVLEPDADSGKINRLAITDYIQQNQHPWLLQPRSRLKSICPTVAGAIRIRLPKKSGRLGGVTQMYPDSGGIIEFSAVDLTQIKRSQWYIRGTVVAPFAVEGGFSVLQRKGGKWQPLSWQGSQCMWVS